jgi:glucosylceramidase
MTYQQFLGFGACITESSAYNYSLLSDDKKKQFMQDMFSEINYSLCRLQIASSDFSLNSYSYAKKHDLSDFNIDRDKKYIIPFIKDALKVNPNLRFLASPWSPPGFMKNTKLRILGGKLSKKYKQTYADYFVKYINSYKELGINIDFVTIQNEPNAITIWESCVYNSNDEADFLVNYLYPTFQRNNINTKIIIYDHNKEKLFNRAVEEFSNPEANKAGAGIAFHWYSGNHFENITLCREKFPDKLIFHTEGCFSYDPTNCFANQYAHDIIGDLNAGINGYMDWNILLNSKGGPNHKGNYCNSPVMLNNENTDYNKTLTYYYIGQISKVIKPGAVRIGYSKYLSDIHVTAFKNTDNTIAVVMFNGSGNNVDFKLCMGNMMFSDTIEKDSIISYVIE